MRAAIHPEYKTIKVTCSCGHVFETRSTLCHDLTIEVCANCHPFYTGEQRFVDTASRIDKFQKKLERAKVFQATATEKKEEKRRQDSGPKSLREMLMSLK